MAQVTELGYLGISVSDAQAWRTYAGEVVGTEAKGYGLDIDLG